MIKFNSPKKLNGAELVAQLRTNGISINDLTSPVIDGNGDLWLDIEENDVEVATEIVEKHVGKIKPNEATIEDKLAFVGLTVDELKVALGI